MLLCYTTGAMLVLHTTSAINIGLEYHHQYFWLMPGQAKTLTVCHML